MKIYKNPWVTRESYFVKTGTAKSAKMEAAKSAGYSVDFWNGKWIVRKAEYYNKSLAEMPVVIENRTNIQAIIDRAILSAVLDLVGEVKMNGGLTMRLIDADAILKADENSDKALVLGSVKTLEIAYALLKKKVEDAPTVDAVIVTRCKDCKHLCVWNRKDIYAFCPKTNIVFLPFDKDTRTFFCGLGERKDGGDG